MSVLSVKNLTFGYEKDKPVLKNISFQIEQGKYIALIGHNGSGKSTLAKLIAGLLELQSGTIEVFGELLTDKNISVLRQKIGIVFQNPDNQFIGATVRDDIAFGLENNCVPHKEMDAIINEFAEKVNMTDFLDKEPTRLSGGQKQRVAIAGVLAMNPKIIIFDEATAMLDPKGKKEIREYILKMKKEDESLTIISITHDIEEAYNSDEVLVLNNGEIFLKGTPEEVFKDKNKLKEIDLDLPFLMKLKDKLSDCDIDVKDVKNLEELVNKLCQ